MNAPDRIPPAGNPGNDPFVACIDRLSIDVHREIAPIEREWRALFASSGTTVYQSFDWIAAWIETVVPAQNIRPAIVTLREGPDLAMILPLGIERSGGVRIARHLGGEHANIRMPLTAARWQGAADGAATDRLLRRIAAAIGGVDLFDFDALPAGADGTPRMLAQHKAARPARLHVGTLRLGPDFDRLFAGQRRARKAKKYRWQNNALAPIGGYTLRRAASQAEAEAMFATFRAEKSAWFRRMGIADSFAAPGIEAFFRALIARRFAGGDTTVIDIDAIEFGGAIHALLGSGLANGRQSGYFLAVTDDEWRRISPGELLIHDAVAGACARGTEVLDLGRGDERYKASWLDRTEAHVRLLRPVTLAGYAAAGALHIADTLARRIRHDERLWRLVKRLRRRGDSAGSGKESGDA